jgi:hypothetical protein
VDAVDAEQALNTLATVFAVGSLVVIVFFFRRAMPVSLALLGWWICFTVAFLVFAPGTISGSEDVARWAHEASIAGMVGLVAGGWAGSSLGEPRSSARALVGWATLGAVTGVLLLARFWSLSDVSCHGRVSAQRARQGFERDTTFCAGNDVLGGWAVVFVTAIVVLFLLSARQARRNAITSAVLPAV